MKKITIFTLHLGVGGIQKAISTLCKSLEDNYKIKIVSVYKLYDKPGFYFSDKIKIEYLIDSDIAIKVDNYKLLFFKFKWIKLIKVLFKDYLKHFKIITLFKDSIYSLKVLRLKKSLMKTAIENNESEVMITTEIYLNELLGKYGHDKALKIAWEHNHHNDNKKYINNLKKSVKNINKLILVSKELTEFYSTELKANACECIYIPNSLEYFPKNKSNLKTNNIITVGRLSEEKGHLDLIEVISELRKIYDDFHLDIAGDGPMKEKLVEYIKKYDLSDKITLHGFLTRNEMKPIMENSSVFVLPSLSESFGIVIIEAFSYGIPAVAFTSARGATEIIENNWNGYLIEDRDKQNMAKRIKFLLQNQSRRIIMGSNANKKALLYKSDIINRKWVDLFEKEN
jgi:Glycosyltransferase